MWPDLESRWGHIHIWNESQCDTAPDWEPNIQICSSSAPQLDKVPPALTLSSFCPLCQTAGSGQQPLRELSEGGGGAATDQSELELCVTCKGEAPECDNSWVLTWSFSAWGERNRRQRECGPLWKSQLLLLALQKQRPVIHRSAQLKQWATQRCSLASKQNN